MICASVFDILYTGMRGKNLCIVCTHLSLLYAPAVMLHSMRMIFIFMIFIGISDLYCGYSIRLNENPNSVPLLLSLVKFMQ